MPQTRNVFQTLTVRENLEMGCFLAPKRFDERYEVVTGLFPRLAERADQRAGSLSGGERQMVAMGRALMLDPSLLLLDEPSAGLSPMLQDEVFLRCKLINDHGRGDPDGRAERPPLPAGVPPRLRARPGPQRLHAAPAASCSPTPR